MVHPASTHFLSVHPPHCAIGHVVHVTSGRTIELSERMASLSLLVSLCCFAVAIATVPQLPHSYHVTGTILLPKADVVEPYEAWVDPEKGMSRIDYYNGKLCVV